MSFIIPAAAGAPCILSFPSLVAGSTRIDTPSTRRNHSFICQSCLLSVRCTGSQKLQVLICTALRAVVLGLILILYLSASCVALVSSGVRWCMNRCLLFPRMPLDRRLCARIYFSFATFLCLFPSTTSVLYIAWRLQGEKRGLACCCSIS